MFVGSAVRIVLSIAVLLLLPIAGCSEDKKKSEKAAAQPPEVTVVTLEKENLKPTVGFTGRVHAMDKVDLRARVEGFLEKRLFTEGQDVKEGDLLFTIEKGQYQAAVEQSKGAIQKAQAALELGNIEVDRQQSLVTKQVGTQARLDQELAKQGDARGELAQQKAALESAMLNLSYTDIRAPISGRIGRAAYSVGNFVGPSSGVLATIVRQDPIQVAFPVTQRELLNIRKSNTVSRDAKEVAVYLQLADGSRYPMPGKIDFLDVTVNQGTDTVQVRAVFPNPDRILVDGQLVGVIAEIGQGEETLTVPQQAIQIDQTGPFVLIVTSDNKIEVRRIEVKQMSEDRVSVTKGLAAGDKVVTQGIQKVRPGQVVQASEARPGA